MSKKIFLIATAFLLFASNTKATPPAEPDLTIEWQKYMYPTEISFAKFSADGNYIYCAVGNTIKKMDASNGEFVSTFDNVDTLFIYQINKMQISNSGNYIVADNGDGAALVYDTKTEKKIKQLQIGASCVSITNDDKYLLIGSGRPETSGVIIYNLQADKIDTVLSFAHNGISAIQISHNGKYFVIGYKERKVDIEEIWYQKLILWDCNTFEQITVLENIELSSDWGYRHLKFSNDDNYLGVVRENYIALAYNLITKEILIMSDLLRKCWNFEFLPDTNLYLIFYADWDGYYELELHNSTTKLNSYHYNDDIIETFGTSENWKVFYGGGRADFYLFKNTKTSTLPTIINKENISIITNNNLICIDLIDIHSEQLSIIISDLLGKTIYTENIQVSQSNCKIPINLNLNTGTYLCKVIAGNKEYTQKIEIVR